MVPQARCPSCGARNRLFEATMESVLAITAELQLVDVLQRIVDAARDLVGASFAAVGVPGEGGRFAAWVTSGLGEAAAGDTPAAEGLLAAMLVQPEPYATSDVRADPRFTGWPAGYPALRSFLGYPIVSERRTVGAFYLANENTWGFSADDRRLIELLAPHAGLAIRNARLHERSRELSIVEERNRLARDLHDSVTQALFSIRLAADTTLTLLDEQPDAARTQVERLTELARVALAEMRAFIQELRPPRVDDDGLAASLRSHAEVLRHLHGARVAVDADEVRLDARRGSELLMLAREALANAVKHAGADAIQVQLRGDGNGTLRLVVADDGCGFRPDVAKEAGGLGLVSMRERAEAIGGRLSIESTPSRGTVVTVEVDR